MRRRLQLLALLVAAFAVRVWLVVVVYPGQGFAGDIDLFLQWSQGVSERGPAGFYGGDSTANYPPVAVYALWGVHALAQLWTQVFGGDPAAALLVLIKVPAIVADIGVAAVAYAITTRLSGPRPALVAAALCCIAPPLWYTSALWGQIDSLLIFFSMASLALLVRGRAELAAVAAVGAVLVKPQGIVVVLVVAVVLLARFIPRQVDGRRSLGRLVMSVAAAVATALVLIVPFDYQALAPAGWQRVPFLGDLAGLVSQSVATSRLFPVLTANAYNLWALLGDPPLVRSMGTGTAVWHPDTLQVGGVAAGLIGLVLLGVTVAAVVVGLVLRHDTVGVLFGYLVLSYALYALPTRSHERYLLPAFAVGAVLAAPHLWRVIAYLVAALVNVVNLHAVLAGPLGMVTQNSGEALPVGGDQQSRRPRGGGGPGGGGPPSRGQPDGQDPSAHASNISLAYGDLARTEWVAVTVSLAQTAFMVALLVGWVLIVRRRSRPPGPTEWRPAPNGRADEPPAGRSPGASGPAARSGSRAATA